MMMGILILAMLIGATAAGAALATGYSVLAALIAYGATGVLGTLALALRVALRPDLGARGLRMGPVDVSS